MTQKSLDWLISVDDHVLEPPGVWLDRVPARDRDRAPHIERDSTSECWVYEGKRIPTTGLAAVAGKSKEEFNPEPVTYEEMRPGCYDPRARAQDMDQAGILASLCFPSVTRFCGQIFLEAKDREFAFVCLQAYNDWMIDDWCQAVPGRFIPLVLIPLWDPALAARELERCAAKGATSFAFTENGAPLGLPTLFDTARYWDPMFAAAADLGMVASIHVGSSSQVHRIAPDSHFIADESWGAVRTSAALLALLFSGILTRFPGLRVALSEGGIGWIPYFLERAEQVLDKQKHWVKKGLHYRNHAGTDIDLENLDIRALFKDHIYGCFIDDIHGIASIDEIGVDNVMCETDYPHSDSTWPDSIGLIKNRIGHLAPDVQYKILRGNAERLYRFTPAEPPFLATA
ncbi:amidohydrolase family protein [Nocardia pseudovaccinii]|uniref:amidohydrolase family protein n=1 Tax=Nocardia pseudovaccinii TaxID=189540 RepID=UPI0007A45DC6|nr:amidohydrolase family protein [Nocardia pseudovaccinii]